MSDYTPTGDGWIAGPPAADAGPIETVRYSVTIANDEDGRGLNHEQVWHRSLPGLPTAPGYYLATLGGGAVELLDGTTPQWFDGLGKNLTEEQVRAFGPLQRLVTAAEVLEQVRQAITALGALDGDAKAAVYTALDGIADGYGVNG